MLYRVIALLIVAVGLLSIPSACHRESVATESKDASNPTGHVAGVAAESAEKPLSKGPTEVITLSDANFDKLVLKADRLVVVDFYADWCKPCKALAPRIAELAKENKGDVVFGKLDTDANGKVSGKYTVRALPTVMIFKNGKPVDTLVGLWPKDYIQKKIDSASR